MEVLGYSETGIIGSLFYEMRERKTPELVAELLSLVSFPCRDVTFDVRSAKVFIDQSFSDFGTADALLLVENGGIKQAIFIEAKVKTDGKALWSVVKEFDAFRKGVEEVEVSSSNLFTQLYHKVRLVKALQAGGIKKLDSGVCFPEASSKIKRKIGRNKVVRKAACQLLSYAGDALFVALLPEDTKNLKTFFQDTLKSYQLESFQEWDTRGWGYLTWRQVEDFCWKCSLRHTLRVFEFNEGQIY